MNINNYKLFINILIVVNVYYFTTVLAQEHDSYFYFEQGHNSFRQKNYESAISHFNLADSLFKKSNNFKGSYLCSYYSGLCFFEDKKNNNAFKSFKSSLKIFNTVADSLRNQMVDIIPFVYMNLGKITYESNDLIVALNHFENSLRFYYQKSNPADSVIFSLLNNIGAIHGELGNFNKALQFLNQAGKYLNLKNSRLVYNHYMTLSKLNKDKGDEKASELAYQKAKEHSVLLQNDPLVILNKILAAFHSTPVLALSSLDSLISELKKQKETPFLAKGFQIKGYILCQNNAFKSAIAAFDSSLLYSQKSENVRMIFENFLHLGNIYMKNMNFKRSLNYFKNARKIQLYNNLTDQNSWYLYYGLAKAFQNLNAPDSAKFCYSKSIDLIEAMRVSIRSDEIRFSFGLNKLQVYDDFVSFLVEECKNYNLAFNYVQKSKARVFFEKIAKSNNQKVAEDLSNIKTVDWDQMQSSLDSQTAFIDYYVTRSKTYLWLTTSDSTSFKKIEVSESKLRQAVFMLLNSLNRRESESLSYCKQFYDEIFIRLSRYPKTIYISPHKILHYIPFQVFFDGEKYLLEKTNIINVPSANLFYAYQTNYSKKQVNINYAFANPKFEDFDSLQFAIQEIDTMSHYFLNTKIFNNHIATESNSKKINEFNILHFACHGYFDKNNPSQSFLALKADYTNDGKLTIAEIINTKYNGNLVVLSACQSAIGELTAGDEIVGLTRAFMYAGTNMVIASLWKINDISSFLLMCSFYRFLSLDYPISESLRMAQLSLRRDEFEIRQSKGKGTVSFEHPYYWAPFVVYGYDFSLNFDNKLR